MHYAADLAELGGPPGQRGDRLAGGDRLLEIMAPDPPSCCCTFSRSFDVVLDLVVRLSGSALRRSSGPAGAPDDRLADAPARTVDHGALRRSPDLRVPARPPRGMRGRAVLAKTIGARLAPMMD
ncbi:hypothetical protein GCM10023334_095080 [Nonomuraea thailandensis]